MSRTESSWSWAARGLCLTLCFITALPALAGKSQTVEEMKARLADASVPDRPPLCIQIAEKRLGETATFLAADDSEKAGGSLADVVAFAELARDYSVQAHKHEKQSEIAVRKMTRKLADLKHTAGFADQKPIQDAIDRLEKVRDDLLQAMFPKGKNK